jgi:hypothetical protein
VGCCAPAEQSDQLVLKDKNDADAGIKATKVVGHNRKTECWSLDILGGSRINFLLFSIVEIFCWNYLG